MLDVYRGAHLLLAVITTATFAASCGTDERAFEAGTPSVVGSPSPTGPTRLAKVEAACTLLPADTVTKLLGSSKGTTLEGKEGPVDNSEGQSEYTCTYGRGGAEALSFKVLISPGRAGNARAIIDNIAKAARVKPSRWPGWARPQSATSPATGSGRSPRRRRIKPNCAH